MSDSELKTENIVKSELKVKEPESKSPAKVIDSDDSPVKIKGGNEKEEEGGGEDQDADEEEEDDDDEDDDEEEEKGI
ncbi:unnamed protein product [[Candida] boidinii]|nr:unnamed protein product [[Candida] boidinii]